MSNRCMTYGTLSTQVVKHLRCILKPMSLVRLTCYCAILLVIGIPANAGAIFALDTPLGPLQPGEIASASVILNQDVFSTITVSFTYQLNSRFVLGGGLYLNNVLSAPVLVAGQLPFLSAFGVPVTTVVGGNVAQDLAAQSVVVQLLTTAGELTGGGRLILSDRQGGGPPEPPPFFEDVPEPSALSMLVMGCAFLVGYKRMRRVGNAVS